MFQWCEWCYPALKSVLTTEELVTMPPLQVMWLFPRLADMHTESKNTTAEQEANTMIYKAEQVHIFGAWDSTHSLPMLQPLVSC